MSDTTLIERPATAGVTETTPTAVRTAHAVAQAATQAASTSARAAAHAAHPGATHTAARTATTAATPAAASGAPAAPATRTILSFERTAAGDAQLRDPGLVLSPQVTRLLMLFEEPQTIDGLRSMIDEAWLPEALIELERRKLVRRATLVRPVEAAPAAAPAPEAAIPVMQTRAPDLAKEAAIRLARQRAQARILFLQQIGRLSTLMIERIESCQSEAELERLTPAFAELLPAAPETQPRAA